MDRTEAQIVSYGSLLKPKFPPVPTFIQEEVISIKVAAND